MTRSPLLIVIAALALILAAGALVIQFVLPSKGNGASSADVAALRAQIAAIKTGGTALRVGFVNADTVFGVFTNAVSDLRQLSTDKQQAIVDLGNAYAAGTIKQDAYQKRLNELQVELLDANLSVNAGVLDRMIASPDFADLRTDLQKVRIQVQDVLDQSKELVSMVKGGAISAAELQSRTTQVQANFTKIEAIVNQACAVKIQQASQKIGIQKGYDLVLLQKNVVIYFSPATITDITEFVKTEVADYL
jgi:Skp family chaperone for outer membrane proteins